MNTPKPQTESHLSKVTAEELFNQPVKDGGKMRAIDVSYPDQRAGGIIVIQDEHLFDRVLLILKLYAQEPIQHREGK